MLCVFGTASGVGKSWLCTGIARLLRRAGVDVAPYKAQNLSNNAGVTSAGREMGRAQIVQAEACGLPPHVDMNPLLLKPNADHGAQVVLLGQVIGPGEARRHLSGGIDQRRALVFAALDRLRSRHRLVIAEGAGSCAEVNLRARDLVNFPVAHHARAPVLLVADIRNGGVFAQVVGTLEVLSPEDRARVAGIVINRFEGDASLFEDGVEWLEARTGVPVLGVVPWLEHARIEAEDGLPADVCLDPPAPAESDRARRCSVAVLCLPHIANGTDMDALIRHGVGVHYLSEPRDLSGYDLLILPGTKNTRGDLAWLRARGWHHRIAEHAERGGRVLGLCGGYQMMGESISDPAGVEGAPGESAGLGLLPVRTVLAPCKRTTRAHGRLVLPGQDPAQRVQGYEIHVGRTEIDPARSGGPVVLLQDAEGADGAPGRPDGAWSLDGAHAGTYLHGLLDEPAAARALLRWWRPDLASEGPQESAYDWRQRQYDLLADHLEQHLDLDRLFSLVGVPR